MRFTTQFDHEGQQANKRGLNGNGLESIPNYSFKLKTVTEVDNYVLFSCTELQHKNMNNMMTK